MARKPFDSPGGLWDRFGQHWVVVDIDGTRAVARQRALPQLESDPAPHRRFEQIAAPGYFGRKRGKWCEPGPPFSKLIRINGWALLGVQATAITEEI